jgi:thiol-disulfide isomerase/thioredoxin
MELDNKTLAVIITVIIVIILLCSCSMKKDGFTVYRFKSDGCPHCRNSKAEWDKFVSETSGKLNAVEIDITDPKSKELSEKYQVRGVPTVIKVEDDGSHKVYEGPRTSIGYKSWLEM